MNRNSFTRLGAGALGLLLASISCRSLVADDGPLGSTTQNISGGTRPAPNDGLAAAVVKLTGSKGISTDTRAICSGTLISPRIILTAAHCFGTSANPTLLIGGGVGTAGDTNCEVRDLDGTVLNPDSDSARGRTLGCGYVHFTDIGGQERETMAIQRVFVTKAYWDGADDDEHRRPRDVALAVLPHRATGNSPAQANPIDVWLDSPADPSAWAAHPVIIYGWGGAGRVGNQCDDLASDAGASETNPFFLRTAPNLSLDSPGLTKTPVNEVFSFYDDEVFVRTWDLTGDTTLITLHGDSGGPLIAFDFRQQPRVIGTLSGYACTPRANPIHPGGSIGNYWPRLAAGDNVKLFNKYAYEQSGVLLGADMPNPGCTADPRAPSPNDPDCDYVPTLPMAGRPTFIDNCPRDFNPDQSDGDGDGVGDACDTCPGIYSRFNGVTHEEEDSNSEAEGVYAGHARTPIPPFANLADATRIIAENATLFPGDACDAVPIVAPAAGGGMFSTQLDFDATDTAGNSHSGRVPGPPGARCKPPLCGPSTSDTTINQRPFGFVIPGLTQHKASKQGFRWCNCDTPGDGGKCQQQRGCTRDPRFFDHPGITNWRAVTIETQRDLTTSGQGGLYDDPNGTNPANEMIAPVGDAPTYGTVASVPISYQDRWIWWNDIDAALLPPVPGLGGQDSTIAGGRFWALMSQENFDRTADVCAAQQGPDEPVCQHIRKSTFSAFDITEHPYPIHIPTPVGGGGFVGGMLCRSCPEGNPIVSIHYGVDPAEVRLIAEQRGGGQVELTGQTSPEVRSLIGSRSVRLVQAAEPSYRIAEGEPTHVVLDSSSNRIRGALSASAGQMHLYAPSAVNFNGAARNANAAARTPTTSDAPSLINGALTLAGTQRAVFAVSDGLLWRADLETLPNDPSWTSRPIFPAPGRVRALTSVLQAGGGILLYALEDVGRSSVRLIEIAPYGASRVVRQWRSDGRYKSYGLATSVSGDGLLFWATGKEEHVFVSLQIAAGSVTRSRSVAGHANVSVPPRAEREGIVWGETDRATGELVSRLTVYANPHRGHDDDDDGDDDHRCDREHVHELR